MALYGGLDNTKHFEEFGTPLVSQEGVIPAATRKATALANLGVTATAAELNILDGVTATADEINQAADVSGSFEVVTTTNVITAAENGKTYFLNSATGFVTTLPAVAVGLRFTVYLGATQPTSGNHTVVPNAANDNTIFGDYNVAGATVPASAEGSVNFVASTTLPGDKVEFVCDGTNWYISGSAAATGGVTFTT